MKRILSKIPIAYVMLKELLKYYILFPIALWKYRGRTIYLIAERGTDARDNGYHMFRYIRKNHPGNEAYYVITKESPDYPKVAELGNVVFWGTLKHYLLFIAAKYKISSHIAGYSPFIYFYSKYANMLPWYGKRIFLQHGVIAADLPQLYYEKTKLDLFICGAKPEYDYVASTFHYDNQVKYTGLARYDALHHVSTKKQILVMPTWRMFLSNGTEEVLANSEYVTKWNGVLQNRRLIDALHAKNYTLVFYPHYEMQKNLHLFSANDKAVIIADFAHYDVQQLLKESQLLVTDYSSVFFDFAYMKKPCLYYQFDTDEFHRQHYKSGYFNYETMGFGAVTQQENELINLLLDYIENNSAIKQQYVSRIEGFFELHDDRNCERIYEEIQKLDKTGKENE